MEENSRTVVSRLAFRAVISRRISRSSSKMTGIISCCAACCEACCCALSDAVVLLSIVQARNYTNCTLYGVMEALTR